MVDGIWPASAEALVGSPTPADGELMARIRCAAV